MELWHEVRSCVEETDAGINLINDPIIRNLSIQTYPHSMSSQYTQSLINKICSLNKNVNYLEIGVLAGASFFAAAYNNTGTFYGVDNWSKYANYQDHIESMIKRYQDHTRQIKFMNHDCWDKNFLSANITNKIDVFFYDGDHSNESQRRVLTHFSDLLSDKLILIIDDFDAKNEIMDIKASTFEAIRQSNYKCVNSFELTSVNNPIKLKWHNGMFIACLER